MNLFINHFNKSTFKQAFMKQKLFGAAALVAFILAGASCTKQEQSEFNFDAVTQEITISATVTYDAGVEANGASYTIVNAKPAAGRKVTVEVPMASYVAGAQGSKLFETVTDANGYFTIAIPVKSDGIAGVEVHLEQFTDFYTSYESMGADGKPIFKTILKRYSYDFGPFALTPGNFAFQNNIVYNAANASVEEFDNIVNFKGQIKLAIEKGYRIGDYKNANKATVEFNVTYPGGGAANTYTFGTVTDGEGNYSINIPVKSLSDNLTINSIKVLAVGENEFVHYTDSAETVTVYGAYSLVAANFANGGVYTDFVDGMAYNLGVRYMPFDPYFNKGITPDDAATPAKWDANLIGWARGLAGFQNYDQTITIKGSVKLAALAGFGEGIYTSGAQVLNLTGPAPYNTGGGFKIYTDKAGNFSVDIPANTDKVAPNYFNITLAQESQEQPFTFIDSKGKETILRDGLYNIRTQIKPENADWDEYGTYYFKYAPALANTPDEWSNNLIGWYKAQGFDKTVDVKGKVLFAVEEKFGVGKYIPMEKIIEVMDITNGRFFDIKADAEGNINFAIPVEDTDDQLNLAIVQNNVPVKDFAHYTEFGKTTPVYIADDYNDYTIVYDDKDHKWNDLGTAYVKFNDQSVWPILDDTYHNDLIGWLIMKDANDILFAEKATIKGAATVAVETGFMTGEMKPAEGLILDINVATAPAGVVQVLADAKGEFSFELPLEKVGQEPAVGFSAAPLPVEEFTHYIDADKKVATLLNGNYSNVGRIIVKEGAQYGELGTANYEYLPAAPGAVKFWNDFTQYLAGWKVIDGKEIKENVTGKLFVAQEAKARTGQYVAFKGAPVRIVAGGEDYVGVTDNAGKFSIPVLKEFADDKYNPGFFDVALAADDFGKFKHYTAVGTNNSVLLDGNYNHVLDRKSDLNAEWTDMGEYYFKFTPNAAPATWDNTLAGYLIAPDGEFETYTVKGKVQWNIEDFSGASAAAKWQAVDYGTATVTIGYDMNDDLVFTPADIAIAGGQEIFNVPVENGEFALTLKRAEAPATVWITIVPDDIVADKFNHYTNKAQKSSLEVLYGYTYQTLANINQEECAKATGNNFAPKHAAKMKLKFDAQHPQPDGWAQYVWNINTDAE